MRSAYRHRRHRHRAADPCGAGASTPRGPGRPHSRSRGSVGIPAAAALLCLIAGGGAFAQGAATGAAPDWHPLDDIVATAERFVQASLGGSAAELTAEVGTLDPRLKLARCSVGLEGFLQDGKALRSRSVVGVRCSGEQPWKLYLPVQIAATDSVLVVGRPIPRGQTIAAEDILVEQRDVSRLTGGYLRRPDQIVGRRARQSLSPGRVITPSLLEVQTLIQRGQSVTITAQSGGLRIDMAGTALADGSLDERIRVENNESGRIIEAIVRSPEYVEVLVD